MRLFPSLVLERQLEAFNPLVPFLKMRLQTAVQPLCWSITLTRIMRKPFG
jgi:hypothetical protein